MKDLDSKSESGSLRQEPATYASIRPGQVWLDTNGRRIQAHGGSIITVEDTFYWYGEDKEKTLPMPSFWMEVPDSVAAGQPIPGKLHSRTELKLAASMLEIEGATLSNFGQTKNVKMKGVSVSVPFELMPTGKRVRVGVKAREKNPASMPVEIMVDKEIFNWKGAEL
jgi:hypothetical protein